MRNRDLRPAAKANPTIQQAFERFQKYNWLKNLSQGSLDFYAAKGRSFFRFLGDTEQPIHTITEETVEDYTHRRVPCCLLRCLPYLRSGMRQNAAGKRHIRHPGGS